MRPSFLIPGVLLVVMGCSDGPSEPAATKAAIAGGPSLAAVAQTVNEVVPTNIATFVPCANGGAGEVVELSGNLHVLEHITISQSGRVTVRSLFQPQGIAGVGTTTGTKYQATGGTQETFTASGAFPVVDTFVNNFRIIGSGTGNNFTVHETVHVTINANGDVTTTHDSGTIDCR